MRVQVLYFFRVHLQCFLFCSLTLNSIKNVARASVRSLSLKADDSRYAVKLGTYDEREREVRSNWK